MRKFVLAAVCSLLGSACPWVSAAPAKTDPLVVVVNRAAKEIGLFKVDGTSLTQLKTLPAGDTPREVCISPDGARAYVSNQKGKSITVVDLHGLAVAATISNDSLDGPDDCVVSADSSRLYVVVTNRNTVLAIDTRTYKVVSEIAVPLEIPRRLKLSPDATRLFVAADHTAKIAVIDLGKASVVSTFDVGNEPRGMAFTPDGKTLLVGQVVDDTVNAVDVATQKINYVRGTPLSPQRVIASSDGAYAYVLTRVEAKVFAMPLKAPHYEVKTAPLGKLPWGLVMNPAGTLLYATSNEENLIQVIDTSTFQIVATVPAGKDPNGIAYRP